MRKFTELQNQLKKINGPSTKSNKISQNANEKEALQLWEYFATEIEKFEKDEKLSLENLDKSIYSLYQINSTFNSEISNNFEFRSKYEALSSKYQQLGSLFKQQIEQLSKENPSIKGLKNLEELATLTSMNESEIELVNIAGWVGIGKLSYGTNYFSASAEVQTED